MAFGKQPLQTADVGGWRQRATKRNDAKKAMFSRGGYVGSRFANIYRPPLHDTDLIRVIPGQYKIPRAVPLPDNKFGVQMELSEFFEYVEHYDGRTKGNLICSAGPIYFRKQFAQPCIPCISYFKSPKDDKGRRRGRFNRLDKFVFTVLGYGPYIKVDQVGKDGLIKINDKTGKPYTEWVKKLPGMTGYEEKEGHLMHWPVGFGHMQIIQGYDRMIGEDCKTCGTKKSVRRTVLLCSNPKCGTDLIDCASSGVSLEEQERMMNEPVRCSYCGHEAPLEEFLECTACSKPQRASIFDVDISVQRMEATGQTHLVFPSWSVPHPVDPSYKAKPLNLTAMYAPDSLETQERRTGLSLEDVQNMQDGEEVPYEGNADPHAKPYR
jgi:hypothetical protein